MPRQARIYSETGIYHIMMREDLLKKENYMLRNEIIIYLKKEFNLSARQMALITNVSKGTVLKIYNEMDGENRPL